MNIDILEEINSALRELDTGNISDCIKRLTNLKEYIQNSNANNELNYIKDLENETFEQNADNS